MENYNDEKIVVAAIYNNQSEAIIAKGLLQANGIVCFLKDELINQIFSPFSPAFGGIKLCVLEHDIEAATSLLNNPTEATEE
ncbi:MAG: DUF2007 domain-containing protein [Paludibacteraceae bacterium]|nr:DUF2007 domain-containing protein [Paludibacteraceae bacterium]